MKSTQDARALFAAFLPELQDAMKAAGKAERWSAMEWQQETVEVADLIEINAYAQPFIDALVSVYRDAAQLERS